MSIPNLKIEPFSYAHRLSFRRNLNSYYGEVRKYPLKMFSVYYFTKKNFL